MSKKHKHETPESMVPFGTESRRSKAPLIVWAVLFGVWAIFLIVLAILYPARG